MGAGGEVVVGRRGLRGRADRLRRERGAAWRRFIHNNSFIASSPCMQRIHSILHHPPHPLPCPYSTSHLPSKSASRVTHLPP